MYYWNMNKNGGQPNLLKREGVARRLLLHPAVPRQLQEAPQEKDICPLSHSKGVDGPIEARVFMYIGTSSKALIK